MSRMGSEGRECDLLSERVGDWPGSQRPTGCGRGTGAGLGEGRGTVGVVGEIAGLRGDGCGAVGGLGRRAWPWRGRGPKLEVSTEAGRRGEISIGGGGLGPPADAHFGRGPLTWRVLPYARSSRPSCPRETYLSRASPLRLASTPPTRRGSQHPPRTRATALSPRRRNVRRLPE